MASARPGETGSAPAPLAPLAPLVWLGDRIVAADALPAPDPDAPACHTTARWAAGHVWLHARHVARLRRDAARLGLADPGAERCAEALRALGRACLGEDAGIVRLEARGEPQGGTLLVGTVRTLGADPPTWRAVTCDEIHPGPGRAPGAKRERGVYARARAALQARGVDEALLFDAGGRLVEGARSCLVVVTADGVARIPPLTLGGVAGLARETLLAAGAPLVEASLGRAEVTRALEIVALNAVRGARPIVALDGAPVGSGRTGPVAAHLGTLLASAG